MEIGWWGGGDRPGADEQGVSEHEERITDNAGSESGPAVSKPVASVTPIVATPLDQAAPAEPLATVSYLPWATPGLDVASESGVDSTAFRRPFVAPERGFDGSPKLSAVGQNADIGAEEPGDWTAEYSDEEEEVEEDVFDPVALDKALIKKLARKDLSQVEVEQFLEQNGLPSDQLDEWVERMLRLGYVDDVRLAENVVDQLRRRKGLGASSIKQELSRRKVSPMVIAEVLGESDQDDERARATAIAVKRAAQLSSYDEATAERRLTGFLMRKGYGSAVVRDAVKTALAARKRPSGGVRFR